MAIPCSFTATTKIWEPGNQVRREGVNQPLDFYLQLKLITYFSDFPSSSASLGTMPLLLVMKMLQ